MSADSIYKRQKKIKLTRDIKNASFEMTPCSHYIKENRKYVITSEKSSRCAKYIRRKRSYDNLSDSWGKNIPREGN